LAVDGEGSLQTLAEVAIALAGFGSLLVVLRRAPDTPWSEGEGADLLIVVGGSLLVLLFALLPLPLAALRLSEPTVWSLSSALLAASLALAYGLVRARRRRLLRAGALPSFPALSGALAQLPLALGAALLANVAAALVVPGAGLYLLALVLTLAASAFPLISLVARLGDPGAPKDGDPAD
jgi:hypothetical protein